MSNIHWKFSRPNMMSELYLWWIPYKVSLSPPPSYSWFRILDDFSLRMKVMTGHANFLDWHNLFPHGPTETF